MSRFIGEDLEGREGSPASRKGLVLGTAFLLVAAMLATLPAGVLADAPDEVWVDDD